MEHSKEMRKPTQLWQILAILVTVLTPITIGLISMRTTVAAQGIEIQNLKTNQYTNQVKVESEFNKLGGKMDEQGKDIRQILIEMQNKENRK